MSNWTSQLGIGREVLIASARTALAAVVSMAAARMLKLPEFY
jgi:hypothetical protein